VYNGVHTGFVLYRHIGVVNFCERKRDMDDMIILRTVDLVKRYENHTAIDKVNICVLKGDIHAVLGLEDAGKTTLMRMLSGAMLPDEGHVEINGKRIRNYNTSIARESGIQSLYESNFLMQDMTITENIFVGEYMSSFAPILNHKKMKRRAEEILKHMDAEIDPDELPVNISDVQKQYVQLARVYANNARIILADNIGTTLPSSQKQRFLQTLKNMAREGIGVLYFTHIIEDAIEIADTISVIREGKRTRTCSRKDFDIQMLIREMFGSDEITTKCLQFLQDNPENASFYTLSQAAESNVGLLDYLTAATDFINLNLEEKITPAMVAEAVHLSSGYLMMLFKAHLGTSIMEYTCRKRIEKSKELLVEREKRISEIALEVGISNSQYFSVLFKKYTNLTPNEYRKTRCL